jgi:acetolactate synthase-1/2/3 large subunit
MQTEAATQQTVVVESGAEALLATLVELGVRYIFANLGTDYPAIVEALAKARATGRRVPEVIICQHEIVAVSAAQAYAQLTHEPQAVFVHVDVGTANMGGTIHNVARSRTPLFIFAGQTPWTTRGELHGSRTNPIQFAQDVPDQASIVRQYVKWAYEIKTPANIRQVVERAFQIAAADPPGPVYLMAAREPLAAPVNSRAAAPRRGSTVPAPSVPHDEALHTAAEWLLAAERPLVLISYLGRHPGAVEALVALAERLALPVLEVSAYYLNFPRDHELHLGTRAAAFLPEADLVFVIDSDVPWLPAVTSPRPEARIIHLDIDTIKARIPLADIPADLRLEGHSELALRRLLALLPPTLDGSTRERVEARRAWARQQHAQVWQQHAAQALPRNGQITAALLASALGRVLPEDAVFLDETVSNAPLTLFLTQQRRPGTYFGSGGSALGWGVGAALGAKLAARDRDVVLAVGDGSYVFGVPTAAYWAARRYQLPFLTVIYNNVGWAAVKEATLNQYPEGYAQRLNDFTASFAPPSDLGLVAASAGAYTERVTAPEALEDALRRGLEETRRGRAAVLDVAITPV